MEFKQCHIFVRYMCEKSSKFKETLGKLFLKSTIKKLRFLGIIIKKSGLEKKRLKKVFGKISF